MAINNRELMEPIGGYFEIATMGKGFFPHKSGRLLNTGRNALEFILRSIGCVKKVYLPYYTCDVVLEPLQRLHIPWDFYSINIHLKIDEQLHLSDGEYLIANNYFGIMDSYIQTLAHQYGPRLIIDNAQAFFCKHIPVTSSFFSPRKFVGVADGGIAYIADKLPNLFGIAISGEEQTDDHDQHLFIRKERGAEAGFKEYQKNEIRLSNQPIRLMSKKTQSILNNIDYQQIVERRRENYAFLDQALGVFNKLSLPKMESFECPMTYPFLMPNGKDLKDNLIRKKIFVASYWNNKAISKSPSLESDISQNLVALPCDQRYTTETMQTIIKAILS